MNFFSISSSRRTSYDEEMKNFFFISSSWRTSCDEEMKNFFQFLHQEELHMMKKYFFSFLHHEDVHDEEIEKSYFSFLHHMKFFLMRKLKRNSSIHKETQTIETVDTKVFLLT